MRTYHSNFPAIILADSKGPETARLVELPIQILAVKKTPSEEPTNEQGSLTSA